MKQLPILAGCVLAAGLALPGTAAQAASRASVLDQVLRDADANADGSITEAEARASRERRFASIDVNGDGYLTAADRRLGRATKSLVRPRDANRDRRISLEEFIASEAPLFRRFDKDESGALEPGEIQVIRSRAGLKPVQGSSMAEETQ